MMNESRIYAKEQQLKLIENILCNLCSLELTSDGRKYIEKLKKRINNDLDKLKKQEASARDRKSNFTKPGILKRSNTFRISW